jgi:ribosome-binding protein aMBF1 (putative translation factor)
VNNCALCGKRIEGPAMHVVDVAEPTATRSEYRPVCDDCYVEVRL